MFYQRCVLIGACLLWVISSASTANSHIADSKSFVLTNIHVIDVDNRDIRFTPVVCVVDGIITNTSDPSCSRTNPQLVSIDGQGGYLTPGLIDVHVHIYEKQGFMFALSHGVTHVRIMNGVSSQLKWRDELEQGSLLGSTATVSSPILSGYKNAIVHHGVSTEQEARLAVQKYHKQGYDLIKAYGNLSAEAFYGLVDESRKLGMPVAKHGPDVPRPLNIADYGDLQSYEHAEDVFYTALNREQNIDKLTPFIEAYKQLGVPLSPTLNIYDQLTRISTDKSAYVNRLPHHYISEIVAMEDKRNQVKRWLDAPQKLAQHNQQVFAFLLQITKALHDAGIPLLVGSDSGVLLSPHGLATHNEMRLFAEAGIDPFSILQAATSVAADALGLGQQIGRIKPGFYADFIYTQSNPLSDLSVLATPKAVVKRGVWLDDEDLSAIRAQAKNSKSLWSELKVFSEMIAR